MTVMDFVPLFIFALVVSVCCAEISSKVGINWGGLGNNLPSPTRSVELIKSIGAKQIKIYNADPDILNALKNTDFVVSIMVPNEIIANISKSQYLSDRWVQTNVVPFYPEVKIRYLLVGNEILTNPDLGASVSGVLQTSGTGKVSVSGGGWVWLNGGANVSGSFDVDGNLAVSAGTTAVTVLSVTTVSGSGNVSVNGRLDINADFTVTEAADFWVKAGGDVRVAAGVAVTLKSTRFDTNSDWHLNFPETNSTVFAGVTVSGALQLGGRLHVRVPVKPLVRTVLVTATSISGSFSAAADITVGAGVGRRLLGTGQIFVTNTTIEYDPEGDTTSAASPLYYLSGLPAAMFVMMF